jgi:uncharacterized YigZ family protein
MSHSQIITLKNYRVPVGEAEHEFFVRNSHLIGSAGQARSVAEARSFIMRVRERYPDANHHAWAYKVEAPAGIVGSSDDGEPGGTAGRPMLAVLEGSGLSNAVVVGTRYFGGIKLGQGGLVRAYSTTARQVLGRLTPREYILHHLASIPLAYAWFGGVQYLAAQMNCTILETEFSELIKVVLAVPASNIGQVAAALADLTNGQVALQQHWISEQYIAGN